PPVALDGHAGGGAARRGREAERAGAGEQVEAAPAVDALPEPVEERLANAVGRRAQTFDVGDVDRRAPPPSADDADAVPGAPARRRRCAGAGRRGGGRAAAPLHRGDAPAPTTIVTMRCASSTRANASRTRSSVTASTRSVQRSR